MKIAVSRHKILIPFFICVVTSGALTGLHYFYSAYEDDASADFFSGRRKITYEFEEYNAAEDKLYWSKRIKILGPEKAFEELEQEYTGNTVDFRVQHTAAHIFGELLYDYFGLAGIKFCGDAFAYGCHHSFFGQAIFYEGIDIIPEISKVCSKSISRKSCFHGIGHGILTHFGYEKEGLIKSLEVCVTTEAPEACSGGVFMEYNLRFLRHTPIVFSGDIRQPGNDLHAPCSSIPVQFKPACYYSQPDWWSSIFSGDYSRVGNLCAEVRTDELRTECFSGLGRTIFWFRLHNVKEIRGICDSLSEQNYATLCRSEAASAIFGRTQNVTRAKEACAGLVDKNQEFCLSKANTSPIR